jgi:hypothetical protein
LRQQDNHSLPASQEPNEAADRPNSKRPPRHPSELSDQAHQDKKARTARASRGKVLSKLLQVGLESNYIRKRCFPISVLTGISLTHSEAPSLPPYLPLFLSLSHFLSPSLPPSHGNRRASKRSTTPRQCRGYSSKAGTATRFCKSTQGVVKWQCCIPPGH